SGLGGRTAERGRTADDWDCERRGGRGPRPAAAEGGARSGARGCGGGRVSAARPGRRTGRGGGGERRGLPGRVGTAVPRLASQHAGRTGASRGAAVRGAVG